MDRLVQGLSGARRGSFYVPVCLETRSQISRSHGQPWPTDHHRSMLSRCSVSKTCLFSLHAHLLSGGAITVIPRRESREHRKPLSRSRNFSLAISMSTST